MSRIVRLTQEKEVKTRPLPTGISMLHSARWRESSTDTYCYLLLRQCWNLTRSCLLGLRKPSTECLRKEAANSSRQDVTEASNCFWNEKGNKSNIHWIKSFEW